MKESTATIGDGRTDGHDDRTGSECFPCRWPEIKDGGLSFLNKFSVGETA